MSHESIKSMLLTGILGVTSLTGRAEAAPVLKNATPLKSTAAVRVQESQPKAPTPTQPTQIIPTIPPSESTVGKSVNQSESSITNDQALLVQEMYTTIRNESLSDADFYTSVASISERQFNLAFPPSADKPTRRETVVFVPDEDLQKTKMEGNLAKAVQETNSIFVNMKEFHKMIDDVVNGRIPSISSILGGEVKTPLTQNMRYVKARLLAQMLNHERGHNRSFKASVQLKTPVSSFDFMLGQGRLMYVIKGIDRFDFRVAAADNPNGPEWKQRGMNEILAEWFAQKTAKAIGATYIPLTDITYGATTYDQLFQKAGLTTADVYAYVSGAKPFDEFIVRLDSKMSKKGDGLRVLNAPMYYYEQSKDLPADGKLLEWKNTAKVISANTPLIVL